MPRRKRDPDALTETATAVLDDAPSVPTPAPAPAPAPPADATATLVEVLKSFQSGMKEIQPVKGRQWNQKTPYNPEGLPEGHRPRLRAKCFDNGIPCFDDIMTPEEIAAWNAAVPGERKITKGDGSITVVTLADKTKLDGTVEARLLDRDTEGDRRHNWPPITQVLAAFTA
jgi:hypothetical protein